MPDASTLTADFDAAYAKYKANAGYRETGSTTEANAFATAINLMIGMLPKSGTFGGTSGENVQFDLATLRMLRDDAIKYASNRRLATDAISFVDTSCYRE